MPMRFGYYLKTHKIPLNRPGSSTRAPVICLDRITHHNNNANWPIDDIWPCLQGAMALHSRQFRVLVFALAMALGVFIVRFNSRDAKSTKLLYICWVLKWRSNNRQNIIKPIIQQQLGPEIFEITHPIVPERCVSVSPTTTKKTSLLFRHPSTRRYYEEILFLSIAIIAWNNSYKHFLYGNWIVLHPKPIIQPIPWEKKCWGLTKR